MLKLVSFWLVCELFFLLCCCDEGCDDWFDPLPLWILVDLLLEADGIIIWLKPWFPWRPTSKLFSSKELLWRSCYWRSIEFIWFRAFYICSYYFRLTFEPPCEWCYCWLDPGASFRLKFTPEPNWYTLIVFLEDWSRFEMFAVPATKPLLFWFWAIALFGTLLLEVYWVPLWPPELEDL